MCEYAEDSAWKLATAFSAMSFTTVSLGAYLWAKRQKYLNEKKESRAPETLKPTKWVKVGRIGSLIMYPVKSCKGVEMDSAIVTKIGLQGRKESKTFRDRVFIVLDSKGREATQKRYPRMVLVEVSISDDDQVTLYAPDIQPITFSAPEDTPAARRSCDLVITSDKNLTVLDCGDEAAWWFEEYLGQEGFRLAYYIPELTKEQRKLTKDQLMYSTFTTSEIGVFQNESPFLLIAEDSIEELNKQVNTKATYWNFRPTVLIEKIPEPFAELKWSFIKLGDGENAPIFKNGRPCNRCPIITNDTETGIPDQTREILKTLMGMEPDMGSEMANTLMKPKGVMGVRMGLFGPTDTGIARVGDPVYAALLQALL